MAEVPFSLSKETLVKYPCFCNILRLIHLRMCVGTKPYLKVTPPTPHPRREQMLLKPCHQ